jgi:hypothetical protein
MGSSLGVPGLGESHLGQADSFALKVRSLLLPGVQDPSVSITLQSRAQLSEPHQAQRAATRLEAPTTLMHMLTAAAGVHSSHHQKLLCEQPARAALRQAATFSKQASSTHAHTHQHSTP